MTRAGAPAWPAGVSPAWAGWLLSSALVLCPWLLLSPLPEAGFHDRQRLLQFLVVGLLGLGVMHLRSWVWPGSRLAALGVGMFFLLGGVSSALAESSRHAWLEWANLLLLLLASWHLAQALQDGGDRLLDRLLLLVGLGCALYAAAAVLMALALARVGGVADPRLLMFGFDNHRFFSHTQTVSLPLLGLLAARVQDRARRWIWWGVLSFWWMLLWTAGARGSVLGLGMGLAVVAVWLGRPVRAWCLGMVATAVLGLLAYALLYVALPQWQGQPAMGLLSGAVERSMAQPVNGRGPLWAHAWQTLWAHPWWGVGPLHLARQGPDGLTGAHPHNWLLQLGAEWGVPALMGLLLAMVSGLCGLWRMRARALAGDAREPVTLATWGLVAVALLADGLVSGLIVMPASQLWIVFYLGCAWGWACVRRHAAAPLPAWSPPVWARVWVGLLALGLLGLLVHGVLPELRDLAGHEQRSLQQDTQPGAQFQPRILRAGRF